MVSHSISCSIRLSKSFLESTKIIVTLRAFTRTNSLSCIILPAVYQVRGQISVQFDVDPFLVKLYDRNVHTKMNLTQHILYVSELFSTLPLEMDKLDWKYKLILRGNICNLFYKSQVHFNNYAMFKSPNNGWASDYDSQDFG